MGKIGRQDVFTWNGSAIAGVRSKGVAIAGEPVDVTSDENSGWRTLLTVPGENQVTLSISGLVKDRRLIEDFFAGNRTRAVAITFANSGGTLSGSFYLASLTETGEYNGAATFDAELQSTGAVTYVASASPTNTLLPSISGTPQVGQVLTAIPGTWTGNPSFTYQWRNEGVDIGGATSVTYTPVVGDVGDVLTVRVTATNTSGSANATSGPSAAVIAA
jgi:predicted secreted protein